LNDKEPWNLIKTDRQKAATVFSIATRFVKALAIVSAPFIPFAAEELWTNLNLPGSVHKQDWNEALNPLPVNHKIQRPKPLFKKIDDNPQQLADRLEKVRENLGKSDWSFG
jgi:methionyl-tRNA synthetase